MEGFLGGPWQRVLVRLVILSVVVGFVMVTFGIEPEQLAQNFVDGLRHIVDAITYRGFDAVVSLLRYCLYGAVIVVPIWLLSRLFSRRRT